MRFHWSAESRLRAFKIVGGDSVEFAYDADGRLLRKKKNGTVESLFIWNGSNLVAELNGTGTSVEAEYSYYPGLDRLHALIAAGDQYFAHEDVTGSVIALANSESEIGRIYVYNAHGALIDGYDDAGFAGADRARFKGALWLGPEVDMYYMRNRWYEVKSGRFLSEDPVGMSGGINAYTYAGNDPTNHADPTGTCPPGTTLEIIMNKDGTYGGAECVPEPGLGAATSGNAHGGDYTAAFGMPGAFPGGWGGSLSLGLSASGLRFQITGIKCGEDFVATIGVENGYWWEHNKDRPWSPTGGGQGMSFSVIEVYFKGWALLHVVANYAGDIVAHREDGELIYAGDIKGNVQCATGTGIFRPVPRSRV